MPQLKRDRSGQAIKWRCTFLNTPPKFLLPASDNVGSSVKHRTDISGLHDLIFGDVSREEAPAARYRLGRPSVIGAQRRPRDAAWSAAKRGNEKGWHSPECCGQAWIGFSEARTARQNRLRPSGRRRKGCRRNTAAGFHLGIRSGEERSCQQPSNATPMQPNIGSSCSKLMFRSAAPPRSWPFLKVGQFWQTNLSGWRTSRKTKASKAASVGGLFHIRITEKRPQRRGNWH